jgi:integrase
MYAQAVVFRNSVVIYYKHKKDAIRISTGITRIPNDIKFFKKGKLTGKVENYIEKNNVISNKLSFINDIIDGYINIYKTKPSTLYVKQKINSKAEEIDAQQKKEVKKWDSFEPFYDNFYKEKEEEALIQASLKDYVSNKNALLIYQRKYGKLTLEHMATSEFLKSFEKFLSQPIKDNLIKRVKGKLNDNTISKRSSYIRVFLNWAAGKDYITLPAKLTKYKTSVKKFKPTIVIFNDDEIKQLKKLNLKNETDIAIRDYMLILISTGMRYSDLYTLHKDDIQGEFITKSSQKTKVRFKVPINAFTKELIEKYNCTFTRFKNQVFNRFIKDLLEANNICCYTIQVNNFVYGKLDSIEKQKYQEIGSHTGRRTFIARCLKHGFSLSDVMGFTGHKKIDTLFVYKDLYAIDDIVKNKFIKNLSI